MSKRPDYVPPLRFGEGPGPRSPRGVLWELLAAPVATVAFAVFLMSHHHILGGVVVVIFSIVAVVQALIYAPRALTAARRHERER